MVNACRFVQDELDFLETLREEARLAKEQGGDVYDEESRYTLTAQGFFCLSVARRLVKMNPNMYTRMKDPTCFYRLLSLDYVSVNDPYVGSSAQRRSIICTAFEELFREHVQGGTCQERSGTNRLSSTWPEPDTKPGTWGFNTLRTAC